MNEHQAKQKTISHLLDQYNGQYQPPKTEESNHKIDDTRIKDVYTSKSINSTQSNGSKKTFKWHLWWDGNHTDLRVPNFGLPDVKHVPSKIGSLENMKHKPGGGDKRIFNDSIAWNRTSRTDHLKKQYRPSGGDKKIFSEKLAWNTSSRINSLEFASHKPGGGDKLILNQPISYDARPRIDSGFIYEELFVDPNYEIQSTGRYSKLPPIHSNNNNYPR